MTKNVIGLDISQDTIDASYSKDGVWKYEKVGNNLAGFKSLVKLGIGSSCLYVMEATGPYYIQAAMYLHTHTQAVSVVNPLKIHRYCQMLFQRAKTDKKDAQSIAKYGRSENPDLWSPPSKQTFELQQLQTALELFIKQRTMTSNQHKAFMTTGQLSKSLDKQLRQQLRGLEKRIKTLETELYQLATQTYGEMLENVQSVMGIGPKTATLLCVITDGFTKFEHYKQLIAFVGFSPRIYQSGTSVNGRSKICKMGKSQIRKSLYLCAWSAKHHNKQCAEMTQRKRKAGKTDQSRNRKQANKAGLCNCKKRNEVQ
jgi:transposase